MNRTSQVSAYNEMILDFLARLSLRRDDGREPPIDIRRDVLDTYAISVGEATRLVFAYFSGDSLYAHFSFPFYCVISGVHLNATF